MQIMHGIVNKMKLHLKLFRAKRFRTDINVNNQDKRGRNALQLACSRGRGEVVQLLIEEGADCADTMVYGWEG